MYKNLTEGYAFPVGEFSVKKLQNVWANNKNKSKLVYWLWNFFTYIALVCSIKWNY